MRRPLHHALWLFYAFVALTVITFAAKGEENPAARYWSERAEVLFERLGRDAGLPSDIVTAIIQDRAGFIWVGTPVGLTRFDGYRFRVFQPDSRDPSSLPDGYINALHVDKRGRLWVGTNNGGVARFIPETESFARYPAGPGGLAHPTAYRFEEDGQGNIWVALRSGLARLDVDTGMAENFRIQEARDDGLPGTVVQDLLFDAAGMLWVATDQGLAVRRPGHSGFQPVQEVIPLPSLPPDAAIATLFGDGRGRVWIGTRSGIVICHDPATGVARSFDMARAEGRIADRPHVRAIQDLRVDGDPRDRIWVATDPGGLMELDVDSGSIRSIHHDPAVLASVSSDAVRGLMRDRSGLIWVATWGGGLNIHNPANQGVLSIFSSPSKPESPSEPQVRAVMAARDGKVWLGFETKGIDIIDPATGDRQRLLPGQSPGQGLPRANVLALAEDGADTVWIGTQLGLARYSRATGEVRTVDLPGSVAGLPVYAILVRDGELWLASDGLVRFNPATGAVTQFRHDPEDATTLADDRARVLAAAPDGRIWVGTHRGLHLVDPVTGHVRRVQNRSWDWSSLAHNYITGLLYDRQGRLWVGTLGGGVSVLTSPLSDERYRFITLSQRHGLPGDSVQSMVLDAEGQIWASTEDGIARIDPDSRAVTAIGWDDGLGVRGTWVGSATRLPGGELLFGGREGLTVVRPDALRRWSYLPPLVLTDIRIDNESVPAAALNLAPVPAEAPLAAAKAKPAVAAAVTLPASARTLTVGFAALDYAGPASLRYSYTLEGFDKGWVEVDALGRLATYTNLPPGSYTLRLRATNKEGVWGGADRLVTVNVLPAWYQTGLARVGAVVAVLAILGMVIQARTAALRRQRRWLEQLVAQRTQDLVNANAELERLASTDGLTGLLNRRRFDEMALAEVDRAQRYGRPFSLLLVDLDHFKQVNDNFGHNAGDAVLRAAAQRVLASVRTTDVVARYGGEELAVLLPETEEVEAMVVAERIRLSIGGRPVDHEGTEVALTASVGGTQYVPGDDNLTRLVGRADAALYRAKQAGRNRVQFAGGDGPAGLMPRQPAAQ
ncbi:ligand-binding sensor domain-containing diguanylate cyclase [Niveispirillum sp.]|uniref:ligand-binding sensor domain-containing diguanylate cyclase n=1 Tax=Niveispirillum sp. TaxID=1917217 RepID=UPI001B6FE7C4|nr:ligand-binding sensor domain-containing diguanylate cyclase [Niveispirillum sp.]MBP7339829.1 diguanylate cyclase [Niveispirillum sp.]